MSETKQLTPEELQRIKDLQQQYNKFVFDMGSIETQIQALILQKSLLETEKNGVMSDIKTLGEKEKELMVKLDEEFNLIVKYYTFFKYDISRCFSTCCSRRFSAKNPRETATKSMMNSMMYSFHFFLCPI